MLLKLFNEVRENMALQILRIVFNDFVPFILDHCKPDLAAHFFDRFLLPSFVQLLKNNTLLLFFVFAQNTGNVLRSQILLITS